MNGTQVWPPSQTARPYSCGAVRPPIGGVGRSGKVETHVPLEEQMKKTFVAPTLTPELSLNELTLEATVSGASGG